MRERESRGSEEIYSGIEKRLVEIVSKREKTLEIQGCLWYTVPMTANVHFYSIKNRIPKWKLKG